MNGFQDRGAVHQVVFRWDGNHGRQGTGMSAVAHSCSPERAERLGRELGRLLWVSGTAAARPSVVRAVSRDGDVMLVQRWPTTDRGGRPSTVSHVLFGDPRALMTRQCLGLAYRGWGTQEKAEQVKGPQPVIDCADLDELARGRLRGMRDALPGVQHALILATAELLRDPAQRVSLLLEDKPPRDWPDADQVPLVYLGLFLIFHSWLRQEWTFATYDTVDTHPLRLMAVPRWEPDTGGSGPLARIRGRRTGEPQFEQRAAARLVEHLLANRDAPPGVPQLVVELADGATLDWERRRARLHDILGPDRPPARTRHQPAPEPAPVREPDPVREPSPHDPAVLREPSSRGSESRREPSPHDPAVLREPPSHGSAPSREPSPYDPAVLREPSSRGSESRREPSPYDPAVLREPSSRGSESRREPSPHDPAVLREPPSHGSAPSREPSPYDPAVLREPSSRGSESRREPSPHDPSVLREPPSRGPASLREPSPHDSASLREPPSRDPGPLRGSPPRDPAVQLPPRDPAPASGYEPRPVPPYEPPPQPVPAPEPEPAAPPRPVRAPEPVSPPRPARTPGLAPGPAPGEYSHASGPDRRDPAPGASTGYGTGGRPVPSLPDGFGTVAADAAGAVPGAPDTRALHRDPRDHRRGDGTGHRIPAAELRRQSDEVLLDELRSHRLPPDTLDLVLAELGRTDRLRARRPDTQHALCAEVLARNLYFAPHPSGTEPTLSRTAMADRAARVFQWAVAPLARDDRYLADLRELLYSMSRDRHPTTGNWLWQTVVEPANGKVPDLPPELWSMLLREAIRNGAASAAPPAPPTAQSPTAQAAHRTPATPPDSLGPPAGTGRLSSVRARLGELTSNPGCVIGGLVGLIAAMITAVVFMV
ncbi:hypothetical protein ACFQ9Z_06785 [Streptomyces sp. NPDC056580]|uniref:hypothetical protein n=1 Tax=Streptomyces sp. NPDC056580 TaxID=3345872 RepID=UPI003696C75E